MWYDVGMITTEEEARAALDGDYINPDDSIGSTAWNWNLASWIQGEKSIALDGDFTPDELEALAWWMRNIK